MSFFKKRAAQPSSTSAAAPSGGFRASFGDRSKLNLGNGLSSAPFSMKPSEPSNNPSRQRAPSKFNFSVRKETTEPVASPTESSMARKLSMTPSPSSGSEEHPILKLSNEGSAPKGVLHVSPTNNELQILQADSEMDTGGDDRRETDDHYQSRGEENDDTHGFCDSTDIQFGREFDVINHAGSEATCSRADFAGLQFMPTQEFGREVKEHEGETNTGLRPNAVDIDPSQDEMDGRNRAHCRADEGQRSSFQSGVSTADLSSDGGMKVTDEESRKRTGRVREEAKSCPKPRGHHSEARPSSARHDHRRSNEPRADKNHHSKERGSEQAHAAKRPPIPKADTRNHGSRTSSSQGSSKPIQNRTAPRMPEKHAQTTNKAPGKRQTASASSLPQRTPGALSASASSTTSSSAGNSVPRRLEHNTGPTSSRHDKPSAKVNERQGDLAVRPDTHESSTEKVIYTKRPRPEARKDFASDSRKMLAEFKSFREQLETLSRQGLDAMVTVAESHAKSIQTIVRLEGAAKENAALEELLATLTAFTEISFTKVDDIYEGKAQADEYSYSSYNDFTNDVLEDTFMPQDDAEQVECQDTSESVFEHNNGQNIDLNQEQKQDQDHAFDMPPSRPSTDSSASSNMTNYDLNPSENDQSFLGDGSDPVEQAGEKKADLNTHLSPELESGSEIFEELSLSASPSEKDQRSSSLLSPSSSESPLSAEGCVPGNDLSQLTATPSEKLSPCTVDDSDSDLSSMLSNAEHSYLSSAPSSVSRSEISFGASSNEKASPDEKDQTFSIKGSQGSMPPINDGPTNRLVQTLDYDEVGSTHQAMLGQPNAECYYPPTESTD